MIKKIFFIPLIILISCKTTFVSQNVQGLYHKKGKDYVYDLNLYSDSSFTFSKKYFEVNTSCHGKWQRISNDTILLKCDDAELSERLQASYMVQREKRVIVLNKDKLKVDRVILKRGL